MNTRPPTDQRASARPISFMLQTGEGFGRPLVLVIRPEDLSRTEASRSTVTQTLGREVAGWVDSFGRALPTVTISGHTGWRASAGSGEDGAEHFESLNRLVQHDYHNARQAAIEAGRDPSEVKLIFADLLDGFVYAVEPMTFVLRRSRTRPLLFQYNIQLQAIADEIDMPGVDTPSLGDKAAGLQALHGVVARLKEYAANVQDWASRAIALKDAALAPIAATVREFVELSAGVMEAAETATGAAQGLVDSTAGSLIAIAGDVAQIGTNVFRTLAAVRDLPGNTRASLSRVAAAYNEAWCILKNSLRDRGRYQRYDSLFGASNCSSTSGGRPASPLAGQPVFERLAGAKPYRSIGATTLSSTEALKGADPVSDPSLADMDFHLRNVNAGYAGVAA